MPFADGAGSVYTADVDSDGDTDVLSASGGENEIAWYENDGGGVPTFTRHAITTSNVKGANSVFATDVDSDGDTDVLATTVDADFSSTKYDKVAWYENDGSGAFSAHTVTTNVNGPRSVFATDVDSDGDIDLLSASEHDSKIAWYENDGSGAFTAQTITASATQAESVYAADMDGDGDTDVLSGGSSLYWYENDGSESFTERHIANIHYDNVSLADVDGDGNTDIVCTRVNTTGSGGVLWLENDGSENFTSQGIIKFIEVPRSAFATDVDSDGDTDLLSASSGDNKIAWYENDGSGNFTARTIATSAFGAESVFAADVNSDGNTDVLSASSNDDKIAWYENDGSEAFTLHPITSSAFRAQSVYATDVNSDGHTDVLSASRGDDRVAWYPNDGNEVFSERTITTSASGAESVFAVDVDSDGDPDVLSASSEDDKIAWYENDGSGAFTARTITTSADSAQSVHAADLDGDGDPDVLSASLSNDKVAWYESNGSGSFTSRTITTNASGAQSVYAADLNSDGHTDVLSASSGDDKVAWYENDGSGAFAVHTITTSIFRAESVFAADVDSDGDTDVLAGGEDKVAWYENDGSGAFTAHAITTGINGSNNNGANSVVARDVDGDGDTDVLAALGLEDKIAWYENDGSEAFTSRTVTTEVSGPESVVAKDVDGDGGVDILSASREDGKIAWYNAPKGLLVNSTGDKADPSDNDGTCDTGDTIMRAGSQEPECTLRAAIETANAKSGKQTIGFDIPTSNSNANCTSFGLVSPGGVCTIQPGKPLPAVTDPVVIDGYTQPKSAPNTKPIGKGLDMKPKVVLNLRDAGGLVLKAGESVVKGLVIQGSATNGIKIEGNGKNRIEGNIIGTNVAGTKGERNVRDGVRIVDSDSNTVGGTSPEDRNLISGNSVETPPDAGGISILGVSSGATANRVVGNLVGTDLKGEGAIGNLVYGVKIDGADENKVRKNVVSGHVPEKGRGTTCFSAGIAVTDTSAKNVIAQNWIGTDVEAQEALPNLAGLCVNDVGLKNEIEENVVAGNKTGGVSIAGTLNDEDSRNNSDSTVVSGNQIGLRTSGGKVLGNGPVGIAIGSGRGILIDKNVVGGNETGISSGTGTGGGPIHGLTIQRNRIGITRQDKKLPNEQSGIRLNVAKQKSITIGGTIGRDIIPENTIAHNEKHGIHLKGVPKGEVLVEGNTIGGKGQGNGGSGILLEGVQNARVDGNLIGHNGDDGVAVVNTDTGTDSQVHVTENSIFANDGLVRLIRGGSGLGIDLRDDKVTNNDSLDRDKGPNRRQNYPVLTSARVTAAGKLEVTYRVDTHRKAAAYPIRVEIFGADRQGEEGKDFLLADTYKAGDAGAKKTVTSGANAATLGTSGIKPGGFIVATAADSAGHTSEFSQWRLVNAPKDDTLSLFDFGDARETASETPPNPPAGYPVTENNNGAYHGLTGTVRLGANIDGETDGQPSNYGRGDETQRIQDEDGILFKNTETESFRAGTEIAQRPVLTIGASHELVPLSSVSGHLSAWIDFNRDGDWQDDGEQIFTDLEVGSGPNRPARQYTVPSGAQPGLTFARFRFSTADGLSPTGKAPNGEVEDYLVRLVSSDATSGVDYGDAPTPTDSTYRTLAEHEGASHTLSDYYMGEKVDADPDGQPSERADGDDTFDGTDDEDGVQFVSALSPGTQGQVVVTVTTPAGSTGVLSGWIDFTQDRDWQDDGEQILTDRELSAGTDTLSIAVPSGAVSGATYARFRFSDRKGLQPARDSTRPKGEVEDYTVLIGKNVRSAQFPEVSFPIRAQTDGGGTETLALGLDSAATAGIDPALGERELDPPFSSDAFDARLIDEDIAPSELGEGLALDVRPGSTEFNGTREHEIKVQPDSGASQMTLSWELPTGITGTLEDVATGGAAVSEQMESGGSVTITDLSITKLKVTLNYTGNQPQVNVQSAVVEGNGLADFPTTGADVNFSGVSGSGPVRVKRIGAGPSGTPGISEGTVSAFRYVIEAGGNLSFDSNTEVRFDVDALAGIGDATDVTVYARLTPGTGSFTKLPTSYDVEAGELVARTGSFSEFVFASGSQPLPVELAGLEVRLDAGQVLLRWQTASETNNAGFEVQRKVGFEQRASWTDVGFVESKVPGGTTSQPMAYRFTDTEVPYEADSLTYRLRQVDVDGSAHLSDPVTVRRGAPGEVQLQAPFPNPVRTRATVRLALPKRQKVTLRVYDVLGREVATLKDGPVEAGRTQFQVDTSPLPSGVYFLRLRTERTTQTQKLTVVR